GVGQPRHGGARATAVRPARGQDRRDRRVAARPRAVADDPRGPAPLQAADGNRRTADDGRAAARQAVHPQLRLMAALKGCATRWQPRRAELHDGSPGGLRYMTAAPAAALQVVT